MDYANPDSPPESLTSKNLTTKQYFMVNLSKFIVEMVGTATIGIFYLMIGDQPIGILLGYWVIILFGQAISGAHYNPAITLVFMLRKNSQLGSRRLLGIMYIVAQYLGGIIAAIVSRFLISAEMIKNIAVHPRVLNLPVPIAGIPSFTKPLVDAFSKTFKLEDYCKIKNEEDVMNCKSGFSSMVSECVGSFVFIFLFMICTDKKTQYSDDKVINCFIMSSAYTAARLMSGGGLITVLLTDKETLLPEIDGVEQQEMYGYENRFLGPLLNPALAFGQALVSWQWNYIIIYPLMPFVGSALALVFYEYVFVRSQEYLNEEDDQTSVNSGGDLSLDSEQISVDHKVEKSDSPKKEASKSESETLGDE